MAHRETKTSVHPFRADNSDSKLPFVSFALLILIVGPIVTGTLVNYHQRLLITSVKAAQQQLARVRQLDQIPPSLSVLDTPTHQRAVRSTLTPHQQSMDAALSAAERAQSHAVARIADIHAIQDAVLTAFGLLGLIAAFYSGRALQHLRTLAAANGRRARALENLFETAGHLSVSDSPHEMHNYLTERVGRVLQADRVALWRYDDGNKALSPLQPAFGFKPEHLNSAQVAVRPGEWAHRLLFHNATICSNDMADAIDDPLYQQHRDWSAGSVLAVPLSAHNQAVGILCACDKQQSAPFTEEDVRMLRTFATQAAFVLHSAQLYAHVRNRSEQLTLLARLTHVINSSLEVDSIVPAFLRQAHALVPYARARLALHPATIETESWSQEYPEADAEETDLLRKLRGKARREMSTQATASGQDEYALSDNSHGASSEEAAGEASPEIAAAEPQAVPGTGAHLWVVDWAESLEEAEGTEEAQTKAQKGLAEVQPEDQPAVKNEGQKKVPKESRTPPQWRVLAEDDPLLQAMETGQSQQDTRFVIPLSIHNEILGALEFDAGNSEAYGEDTILLAQQAAAQLAAAIQNARLYQEATHRAEQLEWSMEETHHRIKNNLQAVLAILDLYLMEAGDSGRKIATPEEVLRLEGIAREGLAHAIREVRTIAAVHDLLSADIHHNQVNAPQLMDQLVPLLLSGPVTAGKQLHVDVQTDEIMLPSKLASALALAVNELLINAVRHGGRERSELTMRVDLHLMADQLCLTVADDGPGFPVGFDARRNAQIGLDLTRMLIERDMGGTLTFENNQGATVTAKLPFKETFSRFGTFNH